MRLALAIAAALGASALALPADAASRLKDIADVEGVRENQLVGYGLVVGLQGTGDSLRNSAFTRQSIAALLERVGVNTRDGVLNTRNVAAVMVTANLPPFATRGTRIDVTVSALGDAKNLQGGQLIATPLIGANRVTYAVAQGPVAIGGFSAGGASGSSVTKGVPTSGRIASGATIEQEQEFNLAGQREMRLALRNPDFTTAQRTADAINTALGGAVAKATNPGTVLVTRPEAFRGDMVDLLTRIETLEVKPDQPAKIVIDETSGIIVMGETVRVSTVAIAQGALTISVSEQPSVSQPAPLSQGQTTVVPQSDVKVEEERGGLAIVDGGVKLKDLVDGLNRLGVSPRDMISILQALKTAGAIQAEIEVM